MPALRTYLASLASRLSYGPRINPGRDWIALLTLSAFALAFILVWNLWAFETVVTGGTLGGAGASSTSAFVNRAPLDAIQSVFDARAAEDAKYIGGTYRFADPSQ